MMRLLPALCLLMSFSAAAENIIIPLEQQGDTSVQVPAPGASQNRVLEKFGLPDREHPAVGTPRMSRWDYRDFSVYFENERVITSVRHHQPQFPQSISPPRQSPQEQP